MFGVSFFVFFSKMPRTKTTKTSNTFLLVITIGFGFLFFNIWIIHSVLPAHMQHPADHPQIINKHHRRRLKIENEQYLKQFLEYPLPSHTLRNVTKYGMKRIVAIGDLHGDLLQTIKLLKLTNIINDALSWNTRDTILIQTGDIVDRGPNSIDIYQLFNSLRKQSINYNSLVFYLLGNHEMNNLEGSFKHTNKEEIQNHGGEIEWKKIFSLENKEIGYQLRNAPITMIIGNTLFCHAGLR